MLVLDELALARGTAKTAGKRKSAKKKEHVAQRTSMDRSLRSTIRAV
jgi:hypothetical protein